MLFPVFMLQIKITLVKNSWFKFYNLKNKWIHVAILLSSSKFNRHTIFFLKKYVYIKSKSKAI